MDFYFLLIPICRQSAFASHLKHFAMFIIVVVHSISEFLLKALKNLLSFLVFSWSLIDKEAVQGFLGKERTKKQTNVKVFLKKDKEQRDPDMSGKLNITCRLTYHLKVKGKAMVATVDKFFDESCSDFTVILTFLMSVFMSNNAD